MQNLGYFCQLQRVIYGQMGKIVDKFYAREGMNLGIGNQFLSYQHWRRTVFQDKFHLQTRRTEFCR